MTDTAHRKSAPRGTVERIHAAEHSSMNLPGVGRVELPRRDELAYYGTLAALAAFEIIDWPIALVLGAGHLLTQNHHSRVAREIGEALEAT